MSLLRGLLPAYKAGRLDEYILLCFGSWDKYLEYVIKRNLVYWRNKQMYYQGIPVIPTDLLEVII